MKPYNKSNIPLVKTLRKNMTPWERKLWYDYLRYYPVRFQRQKAIGEYIVDFYCVKARLVIELDGGGHYEPEQATADAVRTQYLEKLNLTVLRICNLDIDKNFTGVCEYIDMTVQKSLPQSASLTAPSTEGALPGAMHQKTIYALGFFDGVHLGHQALLAACRSLALENGCRAGAVTFSHHPETLVVGKAPLLIGTIEERKALLESCGMEVVNILTFDKALRETPWQDFLEHFSDAGGFVCGSDFRFGKMGAGDAAALESYCNAHGLVCAVVPQQLLEGIRVSSTHIRSLLEMGDMAQAVKFLGHPYRLTGRVVSGKQLGRTMGIPTANLTFPAGLVMPKAGVYACTCVADGVSHPAVTNIGTRPTVSGEGVTVESWLLDFDGDLYGKEITLSFHTFLREEKKFASLEELQAEIRKNAAETRKILEKS